MTKLKTFLQGQRVVMTGTLFSGHGGTIIDEHLDEQFECLYTIVLDPSISSLFPTIKGNVRISNIRKSQFIFEKE